jgi:phage protein U
VAKDAPTEKGTPVMQYNGPGERTMTIEGTIFPQLVKDGLGQVDKMRAEAAKGEAFTLCYVATAGGKGGVGKILGSWCIYTISEDRTLFTPDGNPREIQFTMDLKAIEQKPA